MNRSSRPISFLVRSNPRPACYSNVGGRRLHCRPEPSGLSDLTGPLRLASSQVTMPLSPGAWLDRYEVIAKMAKAAWAGCTRHTIRGSTLSADNVYEPACPDAMV